MNKAIIAVILLMTVPASGHESWISRSLQRNSAGEWCCGDLDCRTFKEVLSTSTGWMINGEFIPFDEAMPIAPPDGEVTICRRPNGTRRCVFGLKPGF